MSAAFGFSSDVAGKLVTVADICGACRLCCNGSIFTVIKLSEAEKEKLGPGGKYKAGRDGLPRLELGCSFLSESGACGRYSDRPDECRSYQCTLTQQIVRGEMTEGEAMWFVTKLNDHRRALQELCQSLMPELNWPEDIVGTGKLLGKNLTHYEEKYRKLQSCEHLQIASARAAYVAFVRMCFDHRFMPGLELDQVQLNCRVPSAS